MPSMQFANNAQTTLASICNTGDSSISVVSAAGFPSTTPYTILIDQEFMLVTSGATTTTWGVSRAQEGSSAGTHAAAAGVVQDWTVGGLQSLDQAYYPFWAVSGLTGALQPSRYIGATGTGTPGSGTFVTGDWCVIQTGGIGVCTSGGSPGTWIQILPQTSSFATHIVSTAPGPPSTSALNANLTSAVVGSGSTDNSGTITFTVGASPISGGSALCTVTFNTVYSNANYGLALTISSTGANSGWIPAATSKLAASFEIWNASAQIISGGDVFSVDYLVIG